MGSSPSSATSNDEFNHLPIGHIPRTYKPLEILGKGGHGVVMKCEDRKTKQNVAIELSTTCYLNLKTELAVALKSLLANHIIHADLKLIIMLEDHIRQPLKAKIIDFGLAILDDDALEGLIKQAYIYRAPEIIFNVWFSPARTFGRWAVSWWR